jgi:hypothetical protein
MMARRSKKNCTVAVANTAELLGRQIFEFNEMEVVACGSE